MKSTMLKLRLDSIGNKGSTLVTVLIAAAIGIIVVYSMSTMISGMYLSENGVKYRMDADTLNEEIRGLLSSPQSCLNTFGGLTVNAAANLAITQIKDASAAPGITRFSVGQVYGNTQINTMSLSGFTNTGVPNTAQMTLTNITRASKASSGVRDLTRIINLHVEFDLANKVTACIALSKMSDGIWRRSNPAQDNIYYVGALAGNVGIGTTNPLQKLDIRQGKILSSMDNDYSTYGSFTYSNNPSHNSVFIALRSRGTEAAPTYPLSGDTLGGVVMRDTINGFQASNYGGAEVYAHATQNFTVANKGANLTFATTPNNTNDTVERMRIDQNGNVGIGTSTPAGDAHIHSPLSQGHLVISGASDAGATYSAVYLSANNPVTAIDVRQNSWFLSHKKDVGLPEAEAFQIGRWLGGVSFPRLTVLPTGDVGIGTTAPTEKLHVNGNTIVTGTFTVNGISTFNNNVNVTGNVAVTGTVTATSDRRLKKDIQLLDNSLEKILKLEPVSYLWKDEKLSSQRQIGFVAQDLEKVIPEVVYTSDKDLKSVAYGNIIAVVVGAIKDLYKKLLELVSESHETQKKIQELEKKIDRLLEKQQEIEKKYSQECSSGKPTPANKIKKK